MCLQCSTESRTYGKPFPTFSLHRAMKDAWENEPKEWEKDQLGLIIMNDPTFFLTVEPVKDPYVGMSESEIESTSKEIRDQLREQYSRFRDAGDRIDEDICASADPLNIYKLVLEAKERGYKPEDYRSVGRWLSDYLARWIEAHPLMTDDEYQKYLEQKAE